MWREFADGSHEEGWLEPLQHCSYITDKTFLVAKLIDRFTAGRAIQRRNDRKSSAL